MKNIKIIAFLCMSLVVTQSFGTKKARKKSVLRQQAVQQGEKELRQFTTKKAMNYERIKFHVDEVLKKHKL